MNLTCNENKEATISLDETFDFKCVSDFRSSYEQIDGKKCDHIRVSFRNTKYMDSSALGMLLNLHSKGTEIGAKISLCDTNEKIQKILKISRFDQKFKIS